MSSKILSLLGAKFDAFAPTEEEQKLIDASLPPLANGETALGTAGEEIRKWVGLYFLARREHFRRMLDAALIGAPRLQR